LAFNDFLFLCFGFSCSRSSYFSLSPDVSKSQKVIKGRVMNMNKAEKAPKKITVRIKIINISSIITTPFKFDNIIISQKGKTWQKQL